MQCEFVSACCFAFQSPLNSSIVSYRNVSTCVESSNVSECRPSHYADSTAHNSLSVSASHPRSASETDESCTAADARPRHDESSDKKLAGHRVTWPGEPRDVYTA